MCCLYFYGNEKLLVFNFFLSSLIKQYNAMLLLYLCVCVCVCVHACVLMLEDQPEITACKYNDAHLPCSVLNTRPSTVNISVLILNWLRIGWKDSVFALRIIQIVHRFWSY